MCDYYEDELDKFKKYLDEKTWEIWSCSDIKVIRKLMYIIEENYLALKLEYLRNKGEVD